MPGLRCQFAPDARNRSPDGAAANLRVQATRLSCQRLRNPAVAIFQRWCRQWRPGRWHSRRSLWPV